MVTRPTNDGNDADELNRAATSHRFTPGDPPAMIDHSHADVAELVDAHGSGPCGGNPVEVRFLSSAFEEEPRVPETENPEHPANEQAVFVRHVPKWLLDPAITAYRTSRTTRGRRVLNVSITLVALGISVLAARHFASTGWPLEHVNPLLAAAAGILIVLSYPLKALGWQRVFRPSERPGAMSLAAANGAASVTGAALPGRFDDVIRIAVVRRYPSCPTCVPTLALSLFMVGLLDAAALMPISAAAAATSDVSPAVRRARHRRGGRARCGAARDGPAEVMASGRLIRFRIARWIGATYLDRDAWKAALLIFASWTLRATALYLLLAAMHIELSYPLAIGFLCAGAAAGALPITPAAGAATTVGGGAALLIASGVGTPTAVDFAISAPRHY